MNCILSWSTILEVAQEQLWLMILHLAMLHRSTVQNIIQLHRQNGRSSCLIGGGFRAQPEMHIPAKFLVFWVLNCLLRKAEIGYYYGIHTKNVSLYD